MNFKNSLILSFLVLFLFACADENRPAEQDTEENKDTLEQAEIKNPAREEKEIKAKEIWDAEFLSLIVKEDGKTIERVEIDRGNWKKQLEISPYILEIEDNKYEIYAFNEVGDKIIIDNGVVKFESKTVSFTSIDGDKKDFDYEKNEEHFQLSGIIDSDEDGKFDDFYMIRYKKRK